MIIYHNRRYVAMPYKVSPAIPQKFYVDAVRADKFLRNLTAADWQPLEDTSEGYISRTGTSVDMVRDAVERYKARNHDTLAKERDEYAGFMKNAPDPLKWYGNYASRIVAYSEPIEHVPREIAEWKETVDSYLEDYLPNGIDLHNPMQDIQNVDELERYYEYSTSVALAAQLLAKVLDAHAALVAYAEYIQDEYAYRVKSRYDYDDKTFPEGVEETEVMWHVTTAASAIASGGFKTKRQLYDESGKPAGLGGGQDNRISFTASYPHAQGIYEAILVMVDLAKDPPTGDALLDRYRDLGLTESGIDEAIRIYTYIWGRLPSGQLTFDQARNLYEYLQGQTQNEGLAYSAVFWSPDQEVYATIDPNDVQILEAVVRTNDPSVTYHRNEEEWRVPVSAILSFGPVGSQKA
jgi:hypothetical protein